jgi:hypothetical protein
MAANNSKVQTLTVINVSTVTRTSYSTNDAATVLEIFEKVRVKQLMCLQDKMKANQLKQNEQKRRFSFGGKRTHRLSALYFLNQIRF